MSIVQRDYLMRMIEQCAQAIAEIGALIRAGEFDLALIVVRKTSDLVLGNLRRAATECFGYHVQKELGEQGRLGEVSARHHALGELPARVSLRAIKPGLLSGDSALFHLNAGRSLQGCLLHPFACKQVLAKWKDTKLS